MPIAPGRPSRGAWGRAWISLRRNRVALASLVVLVFLHGVALFGPMFLQTSPEEINPANVLAAPSPSLLLGSDEAGRDVFVRLIYGGRITLGVGLAAMLISVSLGSLVGGLSGYFGGWVDTILMRLTDALMALPTFFLLLLVLAVFGGGAITLTVVIGLTSWMGVARLVRSEYIRWKNQEFVEAARCVGASDLRIMTLHLLPQAIPSITVATSLGVATAILSETAMSYLGLGIAPPHAVVGEYADVRTELFVPGTAARRVSGPDDRTHGSGLQFFGRWTARRSRSRDDAIVATSALPTPRAPIFAVSAPKLCAFILTSDRNRRRIQTR